MSDVTEAPTQAEIADSLLGPEPQEQQTVEAPEAEQQETAPEVSEQPLEQEQQTEEETAENWLPTEQDKVFPDDVLQRYATRYGLDESWQANPQLKQLVIDKINSDIYLQQLQQQEQFAEPEPEPEPTQQTAQPQVTREQYFANLDRVIAERTDPQVAKDFHGGFLRAFGVPEAEIAQATPQQQMAFTAHMSKYALNLVQTFIPDLLKAQLKPVVNEVFPQFDKMHEKSLYTLAYSDARSQFQGLPQWGSEGTRQKLEDAAAKYAGSVEEFDAIQFVGRNGQPLSPYENAVKKYGVLANVISRGNVDPAMLQQAVASQARNARRAEVRRSAGNLGSGQSTSARGGTQTPSKWGSTNQDLFGPDMQEFYEQENGRL